MRRIIDWIKRNKLTTILGLIVFYFLFSGVLGTLFGVRLLGGVKQARPSRDIASQSLELSAPAGLSAPSIGGILPPPNYREAPPTTDVQERLVVQETSLSLLVEDVRESSDEILSYVDAKGGYMVSSSVTQPEEAPFGTIIVRVPSETLRETMEHFRSLAIKVSSEYITGRDVTDEYEDIEARLETLVKTKTRFEEIMESAVKIDDILRVQREIINLQRQIDSLRGRQQLLEGTARLSKITIYMSTDEIALPYTPSETFRPSVIVKLAWRSLVRNLRKIATTLIWIVIYAVIWIPVLGVILFIKRLMAKKNQQQQ